MQIHIYLLAFSMKRTIFYITLLTVLLVSCRKIQTGTYTKTQIDSAVKVQLDSFAHAEKRFLDSVAYSEALSGKPTRRDTTTTIPGSPHPNRAAHQPFDKNRIDTNKNAVPHTILDEQFQ